MAKILSAEFCDRLHASLETTEPLIRAKNDWYELHPYYIYGDFTEHLYNPTSSEESFNNLFVAALLILAAEEELDGYPMEATNEETL